MNEREQVILGALLHDIGKFWQRTGQEQHLLHEFNKGEVGKHGLHAVWSGEFFKRCVPKPFRSAGSAALYHHNPKDELARIVQEADHLAAMFDRDKRPPDDSPGSRTYDRLEAITERIALNDENRESRWDATAGPQREIHFYPLQPLGLSRKVFPEAVEPKQSKPPTDEYGELWAGFVKEHEKLPDASFAQYFESLIFLLHKYTWSIPSATYVDYPSISLYDHCRVTSALALCLYDTKDSGREDRFLFIEGDISGIQRFIYNPAFNGHEVQDGMARRLRGRSFYLNLLLKTVADYLSGLLGLYGPNILWATCGHLLIVAPNNEQTRARVSEAKGKIQKWMWQEFWGELNVLIADVAASADRLRDKGFDSVRLELGHKLSVLKLQQAALPLSLSLQELDQERWESPWVIKMQNEVCRVTGSDMTPKEVEISRKWSAITQPDLEAGPRNPQSLLFDYIGRALIDVKTLQLKRADSWEVENAVRKPSAPENVPSSAAVRKVLVEFPEMNRIWLISDEEQPLANADLCLRVVNQRNAEAHFLITGSDVAQGFETIADAVKTEPAKTRKGVPLGFETVVDFHKLAEESAGSNFLGVLRMDVDNLGAIFSLGFPKKERSISKIANLSRVLDWFFSGYLNTLVRGRNLYTTYAGGDDLFIVGAWNEIVELADTIQREFAAFCGHNPALHISAGIYLCKGKFPIGRAAEYAEEQLNELAKTSAKSHRMQDSNKNALALLQRKVPWKDWPKLVSLVELLLNGVENEKISRGFAHSLLRLYQQHIDPDRYVGRMTPNADIVWVAKFKYSVARNVKDEHLRAALIEKIPPLQDYLSVVAGYVLLKTRKHKGGS